MWLRDYQQKMLKETQDAIRKGYKRIIIASPCGSGKTRLFAWMVKMATEKRKRVLIVVHRIEILAQIKATMQKLGVDNDLYQAMMVQTATRKSDAFFIDFDMLVIDECHHNTVSNKTYQRIANMFEYIIGVSATPIKPNGRDGLCETFDWIVQGPQVRYLIDNGYLSEFDFYKGVTVKLGKIKITHGEYDTKQMAIVLEHPDVYVDCVRNYKKYADGAKTIVYCVTVAAADGTAATFAEAGYSVASVNGKTQKKDRESIFERFRNGEITIITNAMLVEEGVDVPSCDCVMFWKKTKSLRLWLQATMRCMRIDNENPNKRAKILDGFNNVAEHGLPDKERTWWLELKPREKGEPPLKLCPECENVMNVSTMVCPECGYVYSTSEKQPPEQELYLLTKDELKRNKNWRHFETWEDLRYAQKMLGYKFGWCLYQAVAKSIPIPECYKYRMKIMGLA